MSEIRRRTPLHTRKPLEAPGSVARIAELPFLGKLVLRVDPAAGSEPVEEAVGIPLPVEACTATGDAATAILWIGPDEFWVITPADKQQTAIEALETDLSGQHHQVADVTAYYTAIEIAGPRAREMLMKLTMLDLDARAFTAGQVAGSMFAAAQAYLWQVADDEAEGGPVFRLFVRRSMADYLWCLLAEAGFEWGMPGQTPLGGETWRLER